MHITPPRYRGGVFYVSTAAIGNFVQKPLSKFGQFYTHFHRISLAHPRHNVL